MLQLLLNDLVFSLVLHDQDFLHKNTELSQDLGYSQNFGIALFQKSGYIFGQYSEMLQCFVVEVVKVQIEQKKKSASPQLALRHTGKYCSGGESLPTCDNSNKLEIKSRSLPHKKK